MDSLFSLLLVISVLIFYDYVRRGKKKSKELIVFEKSSRNRKGHFFYSLAIAGVILAGAIIIISGLFDKHKQHQKQTVISSKLDTVVIDEKNLSQFQLFNKELSNYDFEDKRYTNEDVFYNTLDPFLEKYYDCLKCVEQLAETYSNAWPHKSLKARKLPYYNRAISLGSKDFQIYSSLAFFQVDLDDYSGASQTLRKAENIVLDFSSLTDKNNALSIIYGLKGSIEYKKYNRKNQYCQKTLTYLNNYIDSVQVNKDYSFIKQEADICVQRLAYFRLAWSNTGSCYDDHCKLLYRLGNIGSDLAWDYSEACAAE